MPTMMKSPQRIAREFWLFLLGGFVVASVLGTIGVWGASGAALKRTQGSFVQAQSKEISGAINHKLNSMVAGLEYLARRRRVIAAVLCHETETANLRDLIEGFDLHPELLSVELVDVLEERLLRVWLRDGLRLEFARSRVSEVVGRILDDDHTATTQVLHMKSEGHDIVMIATPVKQRGGVEGVLLATLKLELAWAYQSSPHLAGFAILSAPTRGPVNQNRIMLIERAIGASGLTASFRWSMAAVHAERDLIIGEVALALVVGLGIAFIGLAGVGRRMIVGPQIALAESRRALAISEVKSRELAMIAELSSDPISINDNEGRMIWCNEAMISTYDITRGDLIGNKAIQLLRASSAHAGQVAAAYREYRPFRGEVTYYRRTGEPVEVLLSISPVLTEEATPTRFIAIGRDISDLKQREAQIEEGRLKAEAANHAKSNFLANMSHEIRTPMNGIIGMSELMLEMDLDAEQESCARTVLDSSVALLSIINDILDFSKVEAGKLEIMAEAFSLRDAVYNVAELLRSKIDETGLEIWIDYPSSVPTLFVGDAGRLRQVLLNLVGNAIKFTDDGLIVVRVRYRPELLSGKLEIAVVDTGIGIPEDRLGDVFRAFEQVDTGSTRRHDGTGLGLAITRRLVELMAGSISASSEVGQGSTFTVLLDLAPQNGVSAGETASQMPLVGTHVSVLTARVTTTDIIVRYLRDAGATVIGGTWAGGTLTDALPVVGALCGSAPVDVVLIDGDLLRAERISPPKMLRRAKVDLPFPVVLLSSPMPTEEIGDIIGPGVMNIIGKPAQAEAVVRAVQIALGHVEVETTVDRRPGKSQASGNVGSLPRLRILAAEDNRTNQLVLRKMLAQGDWDLEIFGNGAELLSAYCRHPSDLVLMDVSMPVMGGYEATQRLRAFELENTLSRCLIIAMTANALPQDRQACLDSGMSDYLTKPLRKAEVVRVLDSWRVELERAGENRSAG